ncbi:MAG: diaminopimelate epimerase [Lachnospiraceae bacterium]|nr:diaminopimelate epimerase [Lachnospiraceae bacterium]
MQFTKMHGSGNDYIYIYTNTPDFDPKVKNEETIRQLSDRHFGIGGDGVIFINQVTDGSAAFEMEMYNSDGSYGEMCGNGIRCVAKYVYDKGLTDVTKGLKIKSAGSVKELDLTVEHGVVTSVCVDMGMPEINASKVPCLLTTNRKETLCEGGAKVDACVEVEIEAAGWTWKTTAVSMGNPHTVVFLKSKNELDHFEIEKIGPMFEHHAAFPERVNTEFVYIEDESNVYMRVWERGAGETLACGMGCCAVATACVLSGLTKDEVTIHALGGDITCRLDNKTGHIFMTGPATTVFEGSL